MVALVPVASTPQDVVRSRVEAFQQGDFGFIYDSYHPAAPFLEQFPDRDEYLDYALTEIASSCVIERFRVLTETGDARTARVIFQQLLKLASGYQESFELAHLEFSAGRWLYLGSDRISRGDFRGRPEDLREEDFARVGHRVFF
jgi:SEC-C motif-containing protein